MFGHQQIHPEEPLKGGGQNQQAGTGRRQDHEKNGPAQQLGAVIVQDQALFDPRIKVRRQALLAQVVAHAIARLRVARRHGHEQQAHARDERNGCQRRAQNGRKVNVKHRKDSKKQRDSEGKKRPREF